MLTIKLTDAQYRASLVTLSRFWERPAIERGTSDAWAMAYWAVVFNCGIFTPHA